MKKLLILFALLTLTTHAQVKISPIGFAKTNLGYAVDSSTVKNTAGCVDTTGWVRVDTIPGVGSTKIAIISEDDTCQAATTIDIGVYDPTFGWLTLASYTGDSLSSGVHTGATRKVSVAQLYFRANSVGGTHARVRLTAGTTIGGWGAGGTGTKRVPRLNAVAILPKR